MKIEDLIKKLEEIDIPEVKISSHKSILKKRLIDWKYSKKKSEGWFFALPQKILVPAGALVTIVLLFLVGSNLIFPQYMIAKAREIAMENTQIKSLISEGAEIKDIKVIDDKAYVLIGPKESSMLIANNEKQEEFSGALAEIQFKGKKVSKIEKISPQVIPLTSKEEETAKRILTSSESTSNINQNHGIQSSIETKKLEVEKIEALPTYNLKLERKNGGVNVLPKETRNEEVRITYRVDGETREGEINLSQGTVKKVKVLEEQDIEY